MNGSIASMLLKQNIIFMPCAKKVYNKLQCKKKTSTYVQGYLQYFKIQYAFPSQNDYFNDANFP